MKHLVVYDTSFGNTAKVAVAIARGLGGDAAAVEVEKLEPQDLDEVRLLVVGSPTQEGRASPSIARWLHALPQGAGSAAAFDTRLGGRGMFWLSRIVHDAVGYAAPTIAKALRAKGWTLIDGPQGFIVTARQGPLAPDELDRATAWGVALAARLE